MPPSFERVLKIVFDAQIGFHERIASITWKITLDWRWSFFFDKYKHCDNYCKVKRLGSRCGEVVYCLEMGTTVEIHHFVEISQPRYPLFHLFVRGQSCAPEVNHLCSDINESNSDAIYISNWTYSNNRRCISPERWWPSLSHPLIGWFVFIYTIHPIVIFLGCE